MRRVDETGCRRVGFAHPAAAGALLNRLDCCRGLDWFAVAPVIFVQQPADDAAEARRGRAG